MSDLLYFWEFDADPVKIGELRDNVKQWRDWNNDLPEGTKLLGIYETFIGQGSAPRFSVLMETTGTTLLSASDSSIGLSYLHKAIGPFALNGTIRNRLLRSL